MEIVAFTELAAILVLIWHSARQQTDHHETILQLRAAQDVEREQERDAAKAERIAHARERASTHPNLAELVQLVDRLCQRIQAPEAAVVQHQIGDLPSPPAVNLDDDADYWVKHRDHIDKSDLADLAMEAELSG